jgi:hypothetical protein
MKSMSMEDQGRAALAWVQVQQRFAQGVQAGDPHLGGGEGVHPGDDAEAVVIAVRVQHHPADAGRVGEHGLPDDLGADAGRLEGGGDLSGLGGDLVEGLRAVEALCSGEKPNLHHDACP